MATMGITSMDGGGEGGPSTMAYNAMVNNPQMYRRNDIDALNHNRIHPSHPQPLHPQPTHPQRPHQQIPIENGQPAQRVVSHPPSNFQHLTAAVPLNPYIQHQPQPYNMPIQHHVLPQDQGLNPNYQPQPPPQQIPMTAFPPPMQQSFMTPNFSFGGPPPLLPGQPMPMREMWSAQGPDWDDERGDYGEGQDMVYGQLEVKHRRRTTPEQLKVLEHWYDVNPKPDNNLREWLAMELGMTKRNVQVWFQNRRAKMKGIALKEKAAAVKAVADGSHRDMRTPEKLSVSPPKSAIPAVTQSHATPSPEHPAPQIVHPPRPTPLALASQSQVAQIGLLPPVSGVNMGRRASLANGEAAKIESFIAKQQRLAASKAGLVSHRQPGPVSPIMGQAQLARRKSIPYPSPLPEGGLSPKISPSVRPMPSALHLAAIRNNSRRASIPHTGIQLISSGPFTPPRVVSGGVPKANGERALSPIKDQDADYQVEGFTFPEADHTTSYLTPPSSTYLSSAGNNTFFNTDSSFGSFELGQDGQIFVPPYTPNGPLPNPGFSFGSVVPQPTGEGVAFAEMQPRGRLGSIASINTMTTDGTTTVDGQDWDWTTGFAMPEVDGFDPDVRRASAPPDLLHNMNYLGINTNIHTTTPMRPSPLGAHFAPEAFTSMEMGQTYSNGSTDANSLFPIMGLDGSATGSSTSPLTLSSGEGSPNDARANPLGLQISGLHPSYTASAPASAVAFSGMSNGFLPPKFEGQNEGQAGTGAGADDFAFLDMGKDTSKPV